MEINCITSNLEHAIKRINPGKDTILVVGTGLSLGSVSYTHL